MKLLRPRPLAPGATLGVFTPSSPAHTRFRAKYLHGLAVLRRLGFEVVEGPLTARAVDEGYRSGSAEARAAELMALVRDPRVDGVVSTIGGANSSSLIPYLDFDEIRRRRTLLCGYSDVTSLHMAWLMLAGVSSFYGPAVMPSFGEWPAVVPETRDGFLAAVRGHTGGRRELVCPRRWSTHFRDAAGDAWRTVPRAWQVHDGWRVLRAGRASGPLVVGNLNTLLSLAGTRCWPALEGRVLLVEQMQASFSREERQLRQLEAMGVLDVIAGLIVGRPEFVDSEGAPFGHDALVAEVVGARGYPIVTGFDCGHAVPMLTLAQGVEVTVEAGGEGARVWVEEPMVAG